MKNKMRKGNGRTGDNPYCIIYTQTEFIYVYKYIFYLVLYTLSVKREADDLDVIEKMEMSGRKVIKRPSGNIHQRGGEGGGGDGSGSAGGDGYGGGRCI